MFLYSWQWRSGRIDRYGKPGVPGWLLDRLGPDFFYSVKKVVIDAVGGHADDSLMTRVGRLGDLEVLNLSESKDVTDMGLAQLERLTQLRALDLSNSRVRDAGLAHLKRFTNLRYLYLDDTKVTDAGLPHLRVLCNLKVMSLNGTMVSMAGVREFEKAMPNVRMLPPWKDRVSTLGRED
jgi:hypothetical protein